MRTIRVQLHSDHAHPAHDHMIAVDADADGVPVEAVSVAMVDGVPMARRCGQQADRRERTLFVRQGTRPDGVWVFQDTDVRINAAPPSRTWRHDPQIP